MTRPLPDFADLVAGGTDLFSWLLGPGPTKETPMTTQFRLDLKHHDLDTVTVLEAVDAVRQLGLRVCAEWHEADIDESDPSGPGRRREPTWRPCDADDLERQIRDAARPVDREVHVGDRILFPLGERARLTPVTVTAVNDPNAAARWMVLDVPSLIDGAELPDVRPGPYFPAEVPADAVWTLVDDVGTVRPVELVDEIPF